MPNQLRKLNLDRVDLVTQGANPGAFIVLAKAVTTNTTGTTTLVINTGAEKEMTVEKETNKTEETVAVEVPALDPASVQKALDEQREQIAKLMADNAAQAARIAKAEEEARVEKERRETVEFVAKAKTDIPNLPGSDAEKGSLLQKVYASCDATTAEGVLSLLKAGDAAQKTLVLMEVGKSVPTPTDGTALSELNAKAEDIAKAEPRLTKQQAFKRACDQHPDLFDQHRREARRTITN